MAIKIWNVNDGELVHTLNESCAISTICYNPVAS